MIITIDPYYTSTEFRIAKNALDNNLIEYKEYLLTKPPYSWCFEVDQIPIMTNFDEISKANLKFLVNIIKPVRPNEEYLVQRRDSDSGAKTIDRFVLNNPLKEANESDYACFFNTKSSDELRDISRKLPGVKFYYFGKYFNSKFKVILCNNKAVRNFVNLENILVETKGPGQAVELEQELNFRYFRLKDRLIKYIDQPYFESGLWNPLKIPNLTGSF